MHFIERTKNCHFVNRYGVLKNIRFGLFSEPSLLCERVNPRNWKICKYSLKMNNYYPHLYIIYGVFGGCLDVDKMPVFVRVLCTPLGGRRRPVERFFALPYRLPSISPVRAVTAIYHILLVHKTSQNDHLCKLFSYVKRGQSPKTVVAQGIPPSPLQVYYTKFYV